MLQAPHTRYHRLYLYLLGLDTLPPLDDPDLIGAWVEDGEAVLFFHRNRDRLVQDLCAVTGAPLLYQADLDYRDWEAGHAITPFTARDLTVAPVWESTTAEVRLDPSVIFGSGFHPSTRLCLEALLDLLAFSPGPPSSVLDLGCGTGLLAIAAAVRGATRVTAVDHNPLARELTRANSRRNGVADRLRVQAMDLRHQCPDTRVEVVVANLYRTLLAGLFENPAFWQARRYILSGFVPAMEEELLACLPAGLKFLDRRRRELWCLWVLENPLS